MSEPEEDKPLICLTGGNLSAGDTVIENPYSNPEGAFVSWLPIDWER